MVKPAAFPYHPRCAHRKRMYFSVKHGVASHLDVALALHLSASHTPHQAGSAFILGPNATLALKSRVAAAGGVVSLAAMSLGLPMLVAATKVRQRAAADGNTITRSE